MTKFDRDDRSQTDEQGEGFKFITNEIQQFSSLLSWRLFTAQHASGVFPPIIKSSMTAVAASGFTFVSW